MPAQWVIAHDERLLGSVVGLIPDGGVLLAGPAGVGKTELAAAAARTAGAASWAVGSASMRPVPLGAFAHLVEVGQAQTTAQLLRSARESLLGRDGRRPVIVVDDAHALDKLSAVLVYQLAATEAAHLVLTVDSKATAPEAITALVSDGLVRRAEVAPLDRARTAEVLGAGEPVPPDALDAGFAASGGNPLYLRHADPKHPGADLADLVANFVATLPQSARAVLGLLAVQDPLPHPDVVVLAGADALAAAQAAGAVRVDADLVRPAHPMYAQCALLALTDAELRATRTSMVRRLPAPCNVVGRLRLALLAGDSDAAQPVAEVVAAAEEALRAGDAELCQRLASMALGRAESLPARLALAQALSRQGQGRAADDVLRPIDPASLSEADLLAWALPRAANQFWMLGQPAAAAAFLQTTRNRVVAPAAAATLDALAATFAMNAGTPLRALRVAEEVLASPHADATAVGWAASAAALCSARTGRFDGVDALAARAVSGERPGLLRFTSGLARITTLIMTGRLNQARALAQRYTDFAELQQPGRAIGELLVGYVVLAQGDIDTAVPVLERSAATLAPTGYSWGPLGSMLLAQALGQRGERIDAAKVLSHTERRHGLKSALFAPELALAKAWTKAARGDSHGAIDAAREAVQAAERGGQVAVALRALQDCARLGDTRATFRAERLARDVDCVLGRLTLAHARALTDGDGPALREVADDLAAVGLASAAADAATQARRQSG